MPGVTRLDGVVVIRKLTIKFRLPQARTAADLRSWDAIGLKSEGSSVGWETGTQWGARKRELRACEGGKSL